MSLSSAAARLFPDTIEISHVFPRPEFSHEEEEEDGENFNKRQPENRSHTHSASFFPFFFIVALSLLPGSVH